MSEKPPSKRRVDLDDLNWFGKTVYMGGAALRLTANLVDSAADRVSKIAAESKEAFERELDPQIEDARVLDEYPDEDDDAGT